MNDQQKADLHELTERWARLCESESPEEQRREAFRKLNALANATGEEWERLALQYLDEGRGTKP